MEKVEIDWEKRLKEREESESLEKKEREERKRRKIRTSRKELGAGKLNCVISCFVSVVFLARITRF